MAIVLVNAAENVENVRVTGFLTGVRNTCVILTKNELVLENEQCIRIPEAAFEATLANGQKIAGKLDKNGVAQLKGAACAPVSVVYPDLDDVAAKSLAGSLAKALKEEDPENVYRVLKHSPTMLKKVVQAYDTYFNNLSGEGMLADLESKSEYGHMFFGYRMSPVNALLTRAGLPTKENARFVASGENGGNFEIRATPHKRTITPGTKVKFECVDKREQLDRASEDFVPKFQWFCLNDRSAVVHGCCSHKVLGPRARSWETDKWVLNGDHSVICRVECSRGIYYYEYHQSVAEVDAVLDSALSAVGDDTFQCPQAEAVVLASYIDVLQKARVHEEETLGNELSEQESENLEAQLQNLQNYHDMLEERLASTQKQAELRTPFKAVHLARGTLQETQLRVFLAPLHKAGETPRWVIVDWTNPAVRQTTGEYEGEGSTDEEAIKEAIAVWGGERNLANGNRHCPGWIQYEIPAKICGKSWGGRIEAKGATFWDNVQMYLGATAAMASVAAGIITLLSPVPGSRVVSGMIWTSLLSTAGSAVIGIGQRYDEGFSNWRDDTFDGLTIAGCIFGGAWIRCAKVTTNVPGRGVGTYVLIGDISVTAAQGVLIAVEAIDEYEEILNNPNDLPHERTRKLLIFFARLSAEGAMTAFALRSTQIDLDLRTRAKAAGKTMVARLRDSENTVDLTKPHGADVEVQNGRYVSTVTEEPHIARTAPTRAPRVKRRLPSDMRLDDDLARRVHQAEYVTLNDKEILLGLAPDRSITVALGDQTMTMTVREAAMDIVAKADPHTRAFRIESIVPKTSRINAKALKHKFKDNWLDEWVTDVGDAAPMSGSVTFASGEVGNFTGNKDMWLDLAADPDVVTLSPEAFESWVGSSHNIPTEARRATFDARARWKKKLGSRVFASSTETDIPGMEVYHVTVASQEANVRLGPKNYGKGMGGAGLYVFVEGQKLSAEEFSGNVGQNYRGAGNVAPPWAPRHKGTPDFSTVILTGRVDSSKRLRVGKFKLVRSYSGSKFDLEEGVLVASWADHPILKDVIETEFDVLDLSVGDALTVGGADRFLVIHESAGADAIRWNTKSEKI